MKENWLPEELFSMLPHLVTTKKKKYIYLKASTSLVAQTVKRLPAVRETQVRSLGWEDPLEKEMAIHSRTLPGKSHGQRSLVGYSPWGRKESDTTE